MKTRNPKSETIFKYLNIKIFGFVSCFVLIASCFAALLFVPHALAADGFTALAPIPGLTDNTNTAVVNSDSLANFFNNLYKYLIGIAAILAVIQIIRAGIEVATNQDNVSKLTENKGKISQAILGLVLVLSPVVVFSIINPSILNLSLNLPALDTKSSTSQTQVVNTTSPSGAKTIVPITPNSQYMPCTASTCNDVIKACVLKGGSATPSSGTVVCLKPDLSEDPSGRTDKVFQSYACVAGESLSVKCIAFIK